MRINSVNGATAFGRVVRLKAPPEKIDFSAVDREFGVLYELENVLNSKEIGSYTEDEADKIREFFKKILGDYNGENGVMIEKAFGETVIISGEDAETVKELEKKHKVSYRNSSWRHKAKGKVKSKEFAKVKRACLPIAKEIEKRSESGFEDKPNSEISFSYRTYPSGKNADIKDFSKFGQIEYASMQYIDRVRKTNDSAKFGMLTVLRSISYEKDELKL